MVNQLFKNLPVRKQFYNTTKKKRDEVKKVEDLVTSFSVVRHDVRFTLRHNKEILCQVDFCVWRKFFDLVEHVHCLTHPPSQKVQSCSCLLQSNAVRSPKDVLLKVFGAGTMSHMQHVTKQTPDSAVSAEIFDVEVTLVCCANVHVTRTKEFACVFHEGRFLNEDCPRWLGLAGVCGDVPSQVELRRTAV